MQKRILLLIFCCSLFSCTSNPVQYSHLRSGALPPAAEVHQLFKVGIISSESEVISQQGLQEALTASLAGNHYLGEQDRYIINASVQQADIKWGFTTAANITIHYQIIDSLQGNTLIETDLSTTATQKVKLNLMSVLLDGIGQAAANANGVYLVQQGGGQIVKATNTDGDAEYAYPEIGTCVNAEIAEVRVKAVTNTALRKNFVELIKLLNTTVATHAKKTTSTR